MFSKLRSNIMNESKIDLKRKFTSSMCVIPVLNNLKNENINNNNKLD